MSHDARIIRYHQELVLSRWSNREWTYKEYIISKRAVFFLKNSVFWQCECAVLDTASLRPNKNDEATNSNITSNSSLLRRLDTLNSPDFGICTDLVSPYNGRELSFQEDGLTACLGILNRLFPAFPGGFTFGLPRHYLYYALLWQPLRGPFDDVDSAYLYDIKISDGCAARRSSSTRRTSLPSWAWCVFLTRRGSEQAQLSVQARGSKIQIVLGQYEILLHGI